MQSALVEQPHAPDASQLGPRMAATQSALEPHGPQSRVAMLQVGSSTLFGKPWAAQKALPVHPGRH